MNIDVRTKQMSARIASALTLQVTVEKFIADNSGLPLDDIGLLLQEKLKPNKHLPTREAESGGNYVVTSNLLSFAA